MGFLIGRERSFHVIEASIAGRCVKAPIISTACSGRRDRNRGAVRECGFFFYFIPQR
jgi:hypothetical protein